MPPHSETKLSSGIAVLQEECPCQWPAVPSSLVFQSHGLAESSWLHMSIVLHWCNYLYHIILKTTFSQTMIAFVLLLLLFAWWKLKGLMQWKTKPVELSSAFGGFVHTVVHTLPWSRFWLHLWQLVEDEHHLKKLKIHTCPPDWSSMMMGYLIIGSLIKWLCELHSHLICISFYSCTHIYDLMHTLKIRCKRSPTRYHACLKET